MAKKGSYVLLPPAESPKKNPEAWLDFFAKCEIRFCHWTDPVTKKIQIVIKRSNKKLAGGEKHLLGKFTRKEITHTFLEIYKTVNAINWEINKRA